MSVNRILSISTIFISVILLSGICQGYDSEGGLDFENESYHAGRRQTEHTFIR